MRGSPCGDCWTGGLWLDHPGLSEIAGFGCLVREALDEIPNVVGARRRQETTTANFGAVFRSGTAV